MNKYEELSNWLHNNSQLHVQEVLEDVLSKVEGGGIPPLAMMALLLTDVAVLGVERGEEEMEPYSFHDIWRDELNRRINGNVYLLHCKELGTYKIGRAKEVGQRHKLLSIQLPYEVDLVCSAPSEDYIRTEREFHELFADKRMNGEWFQLDEMDVDFFASFGDHRYPRRADSLRLSRRFHEEIQEYTNKVEMTEGINRV